MRLSAFVSLVILMTASVVVRADLPEYLVSAFQQVRWVAYSPTGPSSSPTSLSEIEKDLEVLRRTGFGGIVTYGCDGLKKEIPRLAHKVGIHHVIVGIYHPGNDEEIRNAKSLVHWVDGYCVGNEGLGKENRYSMDQLKARIKELQKWSGKPVATCEQIEKYTTIAGLGELGDWLFPNVHPWWHGKHQEPEASNWTKQQVDALRKKYPSKYVICREVGLPTGSLDDSVKAPGEEAQAEYYNRLKGLDVPFMYFEAFDQVWKKNQPVEPFWGLFKSDRTPKRIVALIATPPSSVRMELRDKDKLTVTLAPSGPGFFEVRGSSSGLEAAKRTLLVFVNTGDFAASGWYLQIPPNGLDNLAADGSWTARGQLGNKEYPPRAEQKISIKVMAVPEEEAIKLIEERVNNAELRNKGIYSQQMPKVDRQWISDARDLELVIKK